MTASIKIHGRSWMSRLLVSLTIGLMMLALGATTAFAASGVQTTHFAAPVISTGGTQASFDEDCDDDDDDDDCEEGSSGGGLPATDTVAVTGTAVSAGAQVALNEDDEDDDEDDEDEEGGSGGGGLPSTDTAPLASSSDAGTPLPAVALLVIAGLAGGAIKVASKRSI